VAGVFKRGSDRRGKSAKFVCWYIDAAGKKHSFAGTTSERESLEMARALEAEQLQIKKGLIDPTERRRRAASRRPILEHLEDYRAHLEAKGDTPLHVTNTTSAIRRLFELAGVEYAGDITPGRVQGALKRVKAEGFDGKGGKSARTCNHALTAVKGFTRWLVDDGRLKEYPAGLRALAPYPAKSDRRRVRRPLAPDELARLLEAAERSTVVYHRRASRSRWAPIVATIDGPTRALAYRVAMATGFRANEVFTLTPESFALDGDTPTITVRAGYSKRGKRTGRDDVQPITRAMADAIRPLLEGRPEGKPVAPFPADKAAEILAADCEAAGIAPLDEKGRVVDIHSLRHSYVTNLVAAGVNPKVVQKLARHSSITLTMDVYTTTDDAELRAALEGTRTTGAPNSPGRQ
jgi:integrase